MTHFPYLSCPLVQITEFVFSIVPTQQQAQRTIPLCYAGREACAWQCSPVDALSRRRLAITAITRGPELTLLSVSTTESRKLCGRLSHSKPSTSYVDRLTFHAECRRHHIGRCLTLLSFIQLSAPSRRLALVFAVWSKHRTPLSKKDTVLFMVPT